MIPNPIQPVRIIYFGTPTFSSDILRGLCSVNHFKIVGVVSGLTKQRGRHSSVQTSVVQTSNELGLTVFECDDPKSEYLSEFVRDCKADIGVIVAWRILPETIFSTPRLGTLNLHGSLLPNYRGAAPVQRAVWNGEKTTGLTVFLLNKGIDTGNILLQETVDISANETTGDLLHRFVPIGIKLLNQAILGITSHTITPRPQLEVESTPAPKIKPIERWIDWNKSALQIQRQIHALSPVPSAITLLENLRLLLHRVSVTDELPDVANGTVLIDKKGLKIRTGDGCIIVEEISIEGKKKMTSLEFSNGYRHFHQNICHSNV